jgi:hypothetical protein
VTLRRASSRLANQKLALLTIFEPAAMRIESLQAIRDSLSSVLRENQAFIAAATVVVEDKGFDASMVRTFMSTLNLSNRFEFPSHTARDIDSALNWLMARDESLQVSPKEVVASLTRLRAGGEVSGEAGAARS